MSDSEFRFLSRADVERAITMPRAIALMRDAFIQLSTGKAQAPVRTHLELPEYEAEALFMPAWMSKQGQVGLKMVALNHRNPAQGLPLIQAMILVVSARNGRPLALMEGGFITALRTGAASGLATELLSRPEAEVLVLIGAGVQARTQLAAVAAVRPLREVYVLNRSRERATDFAREMEAVHGLKVTVANGTEILRRADILCTATSAPEPVFDADLPPPGLHINAVGAYRPDMGEIPAAVVAKARIVVDERRACLAEAGDLIQPLERGLIEADKLDTELGEVAAGLKPGRHGAEEITLFKSVGNAVQDLAVAAHVAQIAREEDLGMILPW